MNEKKPSSSVGHEPSTAAHLNRLRETAHDLNNLLAVIYGRAEILRDEPLSPFAKDSVEQILSAAERAGHLARQLGTGAASAQPANPTVDASSEPSLQGGSERIRLLIGDQGLRNLAGLLLRRLGYQVTEAATAGDSLEIAKEIHNTFDLVVIEADRSSESLIASLKRRNANLKAVLLVESSDQAVPETLTDAKNFRILTRPFAPDDLARAIRETLDS